MIDAYCIYQKTIHIKNTCPDWGESILDLENKFKGRLNTQLVGGSYAFHTFTVKIEGRKT